MKVVDPAKYRRIYEDVMKKLDRLENEFLPQGRMIYLSSRHATRLIGTVN
jgi:hypothetical protein